MTWNDYSNSLPCLMQLFYFLKYETGFVLGMSVLSYESFLPILLTFKL